MKKNYKIDLYTRNRNCYWDSLSEKEAETLLTNLTNAIKKGKNVFTHKNMAICKLQNVEIIVVRKEVI